MTIKIDSFAQFQIDVFLDPKSNLVPERVTNHVRRVTNSCGNPGSEPSCKWSCISPFISGLINDINGNLRGIYIYYNPYKWS